MARVPFFEFSMNDVGDLLPQVPGHKTRTEAELTPIFRAELEAAMKQAVAEGYVASGLRSRSGSMARQLLSAVRVSGTGRFSRLHGGAYAEPWVVVHDRGNANITPKQSRKLAIPLPAALFADGRPRRRGPRSWQSLGTFIYRSKRNGNLYVAYKPKARGAKLVLLYLLVDKVSIPKRMRIRESFDALIGPLVTGWADMLASRAVAAFEPIHAVDQAVGGTSGGAVNVGGGRPRPVRFAPVVNFGGFFRALAALLSSVTR
jgi:hypothetical protein